MEKLTKDMNIAEALEKFPRLIEILRKNEVGCVGCMMAHAETLEQGLKAHGFSDKKIDEIVNGVNNSKKEDK